MPLPTPCIGAYPKPGYVPILDWFQVAHDTPDYETKVTKGWSEDVMREDLAVFDRATEEGIADQIACGLDLLADGEVRRENYAQDQCRHFTGSGFDHVTQRSTRKGAYTTALSPHSDRRAYLYPHAKRRV